MSSFMEGRTLANNAAVIAFAFLYPFFKKCILKLSIFNMSILKCVFFYSKSGKFCRSGAETFAGLGWQSPVYPRFLTVRCRR